MFPDFLSEIPVEIAAVPSHIDGATVSGVLWQAAPGRFLIDVPDVARYLVEDGKRVIIDPSALPADEIVFRFLRKTPLAALLFQRGIMAFHAAAVAGAHGVVLLAGDSGSGKSTMAAALLKRGWRLLADDLAAVDLNKDGVPVVFPIFPELELWSDTMEKLELEHTGKGRHRLPVNDRFVGSPQRLIKIFRLSVHKDEIKISAVKGGEIFHALTSTSYNSRIADALIDRAIFMRLATAVAGTVPVYNIKRTRGCWCMDELADLVEGECR